jgi:glycosyltransferase involved in cell wall biosynthesis
MMSFEQIVDHFKPDIVWTVADIWMVDYIGRIKNRASFKWIAYTPVDGAPVMDYWIPWFKSTDQMVMETQYGVDEVAKVAPEVDTKFIYHGCKPDIYHPFSPEQKKQIKTQIKYAQIHDMNSMALKQGLPEDSFIVGTFARNQPRKNFDKTLKAFKRFSRDKKNTYLWLHASAVDQGYNLPLLAKTMGIQDKLIFTPNYNIVNGLSEHDLNIVMNMFDVHMLPTQGEGFGIPILETMAAGVPQIVSDYTSQVEFAKFGGELIPLAEDDDFITGMPHPVERAIPKPSEMEKLLNKLYNDPQYRLELGRKARAKAETMSWAVTIPQWDNTIQNVLKSPHVFEKINLDLLVI